MMEENASLRGKIAAMKEYINNAELETKASRETIIRLVSEAEREQRTVSKYTVEFDQLRQVRNQLKFMHRTFDEIVRDQTVLCMKFSTRPATQK